jgi:superfamily II DNA or RNA helicase
MSAASPPPASPPPTGVQQVDLAINKEGERSVAEDINALLVFRRTNAQHPPRVAIASAYFNPGGFNLLADELEQACGVRLLLGAEPLEGGADRARVRPLGERRRRSRRGPDPDVTRALEGHDRSLTADRDLLGFTRDADAQARRLVTWLRDNPDKVQVRRYEQGFLHGKTFIIDEGFKGVLVGSSNFTYAGLIRNNELNLGRYEQGPVDQVIAWFDEQWDASVPYDLAALYEARWSAHTPWDIFLRMLWELYGADLEEEAALTSRLGLTGFQADGVWRAKRILARRNGVLIADEVGLGKTFIAGELIHEAVFDRRQKVLIIAPATLRDTTWRPFLRDRNLRADVVSFEELVAHIDSAGEAASSLQNLDEYAMVIVDEAHAMRSSKTQRADALRAVLAGNVPKQLVEMTATPVNNSLTDLHNLIGYFATSDAAFSDVGIPSLSDYFKRALAMDPDALTPEHLFDVMDEVAVRRTRHFVKTHYAGDVVTINGVEQPIRFPTVRVRRVDYDLSQVLPGVFDDLARALGADLDEDTFDDAVGAGLIMADPGEVLTMARYVPSQFLRSGDAEQYEAQNAGLLRSLLLKRFESSAHAFKTTVEGMIASHDKFLSALDEGLVLTGDALKEWDNGDTDEFLASYDDPDHIAPATDYDVDALRDAVTADRDLFTAFRDRVHEVSPSNDPKIKRLITELATIAADAAAEGIGEQDTRNKRKVLLFSYFTDTAQYVHDALEIALAANPDIAAYRDRTVLVHGSDKANKAHAITGFAPTTAGTGAEDDLFDLIVTTDVLAEGVNLQQARHIINFDLPWNPARLQQRSGRIDRIGSPHDENFVRCFFPSSDLDRILRLEERLQRKIKQVAAAVGVGQVLPGIDPVEHVLSETRDQIAALQREENALFEEGGTGALSGEEFRRRLANALSNDGTKSRVLALPWGSGTGFARDGATPGFVFCARIGDHPKPWFRYVPVTDDFTVRILPADEARKIPERPEVVEDTLAALAAADPRVDTTPAHLPEAMYEAAFDAWAAAREHILTAWTYQTDPAHLAPSIPKTMRDAAALVETAGRALGDAQDNLVTRLKAPYPVRVQRQIRDILTHTATTDEGKVEALYDLVNRLGLTPPPPVQPLAPITADDIHLVCWTAITPTTAQAAASTEETL